jgi:hypothetical protein
MKFDDEILTNLNFKNKKLIGIDAFGRVYKADNEVGKTRCLKIIPANKFRREEWEASLKLKTTNNENIIICDKLYETTRILLMEEI